MAVLPDIAVIDYGMGNLRSVGKALEVAGARVTVTGDSSKLRQAHAIVFPGVGSFGPAIDNVKAQGIHEAIIDVINQEKPFLGLCLGFQLLFDESTEDGSHPGLGIIHGSVRRFVFSGPDKLKVPHMGWNRVRVASSAAKASMFNGIEDGSYFYFVHSYFGKPDSPDAVAATTEYGDVFCSAVLRKRVWACQFHPEKSGATGLQLLKNFVHEVTTC